MIDDCSHDFKRLSSKVLPAYMRELRARMESPFPMAEFAVKGDGPKTLARRHGFTEDISGCYVLLKSGDPVCVGISRHVFERLRQHLSGRDHLSATLAYRMATGDVRHEKFAADAMADPEFRKVFEARQGHIKLRDVAVIEIPNPLELYLFEAYAAMVLDTCEWNTFTTH